MEGLGDMQYRVKINYPYNDTYRSIIGKAVNDILKYCNSGGQDCNEVAKWMKLANEFPKNVLQSNAAFHANFYVKFGPIMIDVNNECATTVVDNLLKQNSNSIPLTTQYCGEGTGKSLFIIVMNPNTDDNEGMLSFFYWLLI